MSHCAIKERTLQKQRDGLTDTFITLTYAQSLDGSIGSIVHEPVQISCKESWIMTHRLRSIHDGIMVGVGTVISDNPSLTVRFGVIGNNPTPIIIDSRLRTPCTSKLLPNSPIIMHTDSALTSDKERLHSARLVLCKTGKNGGVDLRDALQQLRTLGMRSIMVEGGAMLMASIVREELATQIVVTIGPLILGGLNPYLGSNRHVQLKDPEYHVYGQDIVVQANFLNKT